MTGLVEFEAQNALAGLELENFENFENFGFLGLLGLLELPELPDFLEFLEFLEFPGFLDFLDFPEFLEFPGFLGFLGFLVSLVVVDYEALLYATGRSRPVCTGGSKVTVGTSSAGTAVAAGPGYQAHGL